MSQTRQLAEPRHSESSPSHEEVSKKKTPIAQLLSAAELVISRELFPYLHPGEAAKEKAKLKAAQAAQAAKDAAAKQAWLAKNAEDTLRWHDQEEARLRKEDPNYSSGVAAHANERHDGHDAQPGSLTPLEKAYIDNEAGIPTAYSSSGD